VVLTSSSPASGGRREGWPGGLGNAVRFRDQPGAAQDAAGEEGEEFACPRARCSRTSARRLPERGRKHVDLDDPRPPKIADQSFTTLTPHLGVVRLDEGESFVVADVPGLIPGASDGAGLGTRFLRHLARTKLLVHLVDLSPDTGRDPIEDYRVINEELKNHGGGLEKKPQLLVANKAEIPEAAENLKRLKAFAGRRRLPFFVISAATRQGLKELVYAMKKSLNAIERAEREQEAAARPVRRKPKNS
jgi:GTPase involved in cell partitioning and DNA repair